MPNTKEKLTAVTDLSVPIESSQEMDTSSDDQPSAEMDTTSDNRFPKPDAGHRHTEQFLAMHKQTLTAAEAEAEAEAEAKQLSAVYSRQYPATKMAPLCKPLLPGTKIHVLTKQEEAGELCHQHHEWWKLWEFLDEEKPHCIPQKFPRTEDQKGLCCGIYAFHNALAWVGFESIPARKVEQAGASNSLRQLLKQANKTAFGSIYDGRHFQYLASRISLEETEIFFPAPEDYLDKLIRLLDAKHPVLLSSSLNMQNQVFPNDANPKKMHWAVAIGYLHLHGALHIIVNQYGEEYFWPAAALEDSNHRIASINPQYEHCIYVKQADGKRREFFPHKKPEDIRTHEVIPQDRKRNLYITRFVHTDPEKPVEEIRDTRPLLEADRDLSHFRFCLVAMPKHDHPCQHRPSPDALDTSNPDEAASPTP